LGFTPTKKKCRNFTTVSAKTGIIKTPEQKLPGSL
jgi:hypothetical protein